MSLTTYETSIAVLIRGLEQLSSLLDKATAHAATAGIDTATLVAARLAPDMYPLSGQIQTASDTAKGCAARLAGLPVPSFPDTETTMADLQARIAKTLDFLRGIDPAAVEGAEDRTVTLTMRRGPMTFTGRDYLLKFALPNFFFHVTTAYGILRHSGVPMGKMDYIGALPAPAAAA